jgi:protein-S-isoprenylcysteine O-methyltransferase Ste14
MSDAIRNAAGEATPGLDAPEMPRSLAPAWFFAHLVAMTVLHFALPIAQWNLGVTRWLGLPPAIGGFLLVAFGAGRFRRVTTLRPYEQPSVLVTDGLHRVSRNPMYVGLLLSLVGAWIMLGSLSPGLALPSLYWVLRYRFIAYEEYAMESRFGEAYQAYRRRVRRWL